MRWLPSVLENIEKFLFFWENLANNFRYFEIFLKFLVQSLCISYAFLTHFSIVSGSDHLIAQKLLDECKCAQLFNWWLQNQIGHRQPFGPSLMSSCCPFHEDVVRLDFKESLCTYMSLKLNTSFTWHFFVACVCVSSKLTAWCTWDLWLYLSNLFKPHGMLK